MLNEALGCNNILHLVALSVRLSMGSLLYCCILIEVQLTSCILYFIVVSSGLKLPLGAPHKNLSVTKKVDTIFWRPLLAFLSPPGPFCTPKYFFTSTGC